jgi:hypothetical protein
MRFKPCPWSTLGGLLIALAMALLVFAQAGNLQPLINSWAVASRAPQPPTVSTMDLKAVVARLEDLERKRAATPPAPRPVISPDYHKVTQTLARLEAMEQRRLVAASGAPQPASAPQQAAAPPKATQKPRGTFVKGTTSAPISFGSGGAAQAPLVTLGATVAAPRTTRTQAR